MGQSLFVPRFLARLKATGLQYENPRVERVLAVSRVGLGATALGVDLFRPLAPNPYNELLIFLLLLYCVENLGLLIWMIMNPDPGALFIRIMQVSDVFWPVALCLFADPPSTLVFVFFLFALMTTAYRFGVYETVFTALLCTLILAVQEVVVALGPERLSKLLYTQIGASRLILRSAFLIMAGFLLGYLAEREKELRAEIGFANHLLSLTRVGNRLNEVVREVLTEIAGVFETNKAYALVSQAVSGRLFRWDSGHEVREILTEEPDCSLMPEYPHTFYIERLANGKHSINAVDDEGQRIDSPDVDGLPMPIKNAKSVLGVKLDLGREWNGRFVLVDGRLGWNRERELRFVQTAMRQVAPALYSIYLFRRLRSRANAMERARVARELHDTAIQSLISIEMQVDVLRRRTNGHLPGAELERIQNLLREEVLNLRELMLSMKPVEVGPKQFLDFIAQLVERFRNDTGLDVRFVSELEDVSLPASACRELVRIVQEGLVNIRKHSRAKSVYVRFGAQNGFWKLVIDDDGRGFPFSGRLTMGELDDLHRGPAVIKERIRSIGGDLVIESNPGNGSRLEVTVPQKGYQFYG